MFRVNLSKSIFEIDLRKSISNSQYRFIHDYGKICEGVTTIRA